MRIFIHFTGKLQQQQNTETTMEKTLFSTPFHAFLHTQSINVDSVKSLLLNFIMKTFVSNRFIPF